VKPVLMSPIFQYVIKAQEVTMHVSKLGLIQMLSNAMIYAAPAIQDGEGLINNRAGSRKTGSRPFRPLSQQKRRIRERQVLSRSGRR
jgi:hypothetical protein